MIAPTILLKDRIGWSHGRSQHPMGLAEMPARRWASISLFLSRFLHYRWLLINDTHAIILLNGNQKSGPRTKQRKANFEQIKWEKIDGIGIHLTLSYVHFSMVFSTHYIVNDWRMRTGPRDASNDESRTAVIKVPINFPIQLQNQRRKCYHGRMGHSQLRARHNKTLRIRFFM